jgi:hypothetical protein
MDSKVDSKPAWEASPAVLVYCPSHDRFNISYWTSFRFCLERSIRQPWRIFTSPQADAPRPDPIHGERRSAWSKTGNLSQVDSLPFALSKDKL